MRLMPALLIPALLVACASGAPQYSDLAKRETPAAWTVPSEWTIHIFGRKREDYGVLTLALTGEAVVTCDGEGWKRAAVIATSIEHPPLKHWYATREELGEALYPAYLIDGQNLWVLLNAPMCDNDWALRGVLTSDGASGKFVTEGMLGGETLGSFVAEKAH
jgi:hypothetical protein